MSLKIKDYPEKEIIEIEGIKYSYCIFKGFGSGLKLNEPFMIIKRKDGIITIDSLKKK